MKEHTCVVNLGYHIIVNGGTDDEILETAKSIRDQYIDPIKTTFIKTVDNPADLFKKINKYIDNFTIVKTLYEDYKYNTVDVIVKNTKANYYLVVDAGTKIPDNLLFNVNLKICSGNAKGKLGIVTKDISLYPTIVHHWLGGNIFKSLNKKIEECFDDAICNSFDM